MSMFVFFVSAGVFPCGCFFPVSILKAGFLRGYTVVLMLFTNPQVILLNPLTTNVPPSYGNQSIDLQCRSLDWFIYDGEHW